MLEIRRKYRSWLKVLDVLEKLENEEFTTEDVFYHLHSHTSMPKRRVMNILRCLSNVGILERRRGRISKNRWSRQVVNIYKVSSIEEIRKLKEKLMHRLGK